jgi:hypothetical protein
MDELLIYRKTYDLLLWFIPHINRLPKFYKQVLGKYFLERSVSLLVLVIKANKSKGSDRMKFQINLSDELDTIRILFRMTKDLRLVSVKQYAYGVEKMNEIGKMLYSWMRYQP